MWVRVHLVFDVVIVRDYWMMSVLDDVELWKNQSAYDSLPPPKRAVRKGHAGIL